MADAQLEAFLAARRSNPPARWHAPRTAIRSPCSGRTTRREGRVIRAFLPGATKVEVLRRSDGAVVVAPRAQPTRAVCSKVWSANARLIGCASIGRTPSRKPRILTRSDCCSAMSTCILFNEGRHFELAHCFGAQTMTIDGVSGVRFAVWAPNASARRRGRRLQFLGSRGAIPCGCATAPASGSCSCRGSRRARATNTTSSDRTATAAAGRPIRCAPEPRCRPARRRSCRSPTIIAGATTTGWQSRGSAAGARCADLDLRGAPRLVAATARA